jgi:dTDP-4-dehydrorhamnose 3,5-epimerase-like enzyme
VSSYKCDSYCVPDFECGIVWNDNYLSINWGIEPKNIIVSSKLSQLYKLGEVDNFQTFV